MEAKFVTLANGMKVHMLEDGATGNPPMVLLHGYPASCCVWRHCMPRLARDFHVFAPDLPGHGKSDKPLDVRYDLPFLSDFVRDYLTSVGLERIHLVCHDIGALAGLGLVCSHPRHVVSLVVMDTGPYADWPFMARALIRIMKNRWLTSLILNKTVFTWLFRHMVFADPNLATPERIALFREPWVEDKISKTAFRRTIDVPPEQVAPPEEKLKAINIPTLILWAAHDGFFPVSIARRLQQDIPGSILRIVSGAGHFLQEEKPEEVVGHIRGFLSSGDTPFSESPKDSAARQAG